MRVVLASIEGEYRRYKTKAEEVFAQLSDAQLAQPLGDRENSVAMIVRHMAGNLRSRFTDFLTSDGEKPWRNREEEFRPREIARNELLESWEEGWRVLQTELAALTDDDLDRTVTIRRQPLSVAEALHRSLAHVGYHVGQIVLIGRHLCGTRWEFLSIPPGASGSYNLDPTRDRPPGS